MNDNESILPPVGPEAEESPLRLLDDILHNCMIQKKQEMHRTLKDLISRYLSYCLLKKLRRGVCLLGFVACDIY
jgi:hypothetical protein